MHRCICGSGANNKNAIADVAGAATPVRTADGHFDA